MESDTSDRSYFFETYFTEEIYIEPRESEREKRVPVVWARGVYKEGM